MSNWAIPVAALWAVCHLLEVWALYSGRPGYLRYGVVCYRALLAGEGQKRRLQQLAAADDQWTPMPDAPASLRRLDKLTVAFRAQLWWLLGHRGVMRQTAPGEWQVEGYLPYSLFMPILLMMEMPWLAGGYVAITVLGVLYFYRQLDQLTYPRA